MSLEIARVVPADVDAAAMNVVTSALRLVPGERIVVIGDSLGEELASALARAANQVGAVVDVAMLDDFAGHQLKVLPSRIVALLSAARASAFIGSAARHQLGLRQHLLHLVGQLGLRHAHMPGISRLAFARGLRTDYRDIERRGRRVLDIVSGARRIESLSGKGTRLVLSFAEDMRWYPQLGVLSPGRWGNLPAGALYCTPESIEGTLVANASLGEFFGARAGVLHRTPVTMHIEGSRVRQVEVHGDRALERDVETMLDLSPNSNRIGLVCIGVNHGIETATGESIVDQNLPGLHVCIGDPAARVTGATWTAPTSFAACQEGSSIVAYARPTTMTRSATFAALARHATPSLGVGSGGVIVVHRGKLPTLS